MPPRSILLAAWLFYAGASIATLCFLPTRMLGYFALDNHVLLYAVVPALLFAVVCISIANGLRVNARAFRNALPFLCFLAGSYLLFHGVANLLGFLVIHRMANLISGALGFAGVFLAVRTWQQNRAVGVEHENKSA